MTRRNSISAISLGCPKNRVDTELMLGALAEKYQITADVAAADAVIINTCGFIESAKQEAIDTILETARLKETGRLRALIVTGCLSERYRRELSRELPEADAFLGVNAVADIEAAVETALAGARFERYSGFAPCEYTSRLLTTAPPSAYVRIADGCPNHCAYCAIPLIRGGLRSRTMEDIECETRGLLERGFSEITLIAQDSTKYGLDIYKKPMLAALLERLAPLGMKWLRVLYSYPESVTGELIDVMLAHDNICKYLDIPVQHADDALLSRMNRNNTCKSTLNLVNSIRSRSPEFVFRTTVITGLPGETDESFETLLRFVREARFDHLGAFAYSPEDGTPAATMSGQVPPQLAAERQERVMELQRGIAQEKNAARIGKKYAWLCESGERGGVYRGRTFAEAPEDIDGSVLVRADMRLETGRWYNVAIASANDYELTGELTE